VAPVELLVHPHLKNKPAPSPTSTIVAPVELLDLATVIKVSQAVSSELVLEKLIDRLMRAAIEHAGAERGLLIVPRGDELQTEAEATTSREDVIVHRRDGAYTTELPESLIRYVMRTQDTVILEDASSQNSFSADPYMLHGRVRSILCLPLVNQAKLIGILYLENNLTPHVFTPDRVTVLKVLASQAAISLENTRLYRDLEDREEKIRRLVDANVMGIVIWNLEGTITGANEAFLRMVQYGREDLASGRVRWMDLTPAEWCDSDERAIAELKVSGVFQPYEKEYFRKDGSRVSVLIGGALFQEGGNEGVAFVLDLSEQKRAEAEIRALNERLMKAQEEERMRFAGELHDGVLQQLTSFTLRMGTAIIKLPANSEAKTRIKQLQKELIQMGTEIRHLSHELHPVALREAGLPDALRSYCQEFSEVRGIPVSCEADETVDQLSPGAALCLYRIAQEALGNVAKHSKAKQAELRLYRSDGNVCLSVSDDGVGFSADAKSGGLGLINMRERAHQLHGTFEFHSEPGRGTTINATVPFRPAS
jgi:PAS domain S-box-containing protein